MIQQLIQIYFNHMDRVMYIKGKEISEKEISLYKNHSEHKPIGKIQIKTLFDKIKHSNNYKTPNGQCINIQTIREIYRKYGHQSNEYKDIKSYIPCVSPSGVFSYANNNSIISPSNLLVLDIDDLYNADIEEVKRNIFSLPYVYSVSSSLSGNGLWVIIPIDPSKDREKVFDSINQCMRLMGIKIDKLKDVARLRYISCDSNPLIKSDDTDIVIYDKELDLDLFSFINNRSYDRDIIKRALYKSQGISYTDPLEDDDICYYAAKYAIENCNTTCSSTDNNMNIWLSHLCTLSTLGYRGYELALTLSRQSSSYTSDDNVRKAFDSMSKKAAIDSRKGFLKYFGVCKRTLGDKVWINKLKEIYNF